MTKEQLRKKLDDERSNLPWYIQEYINVKESVPYSLVTLYEYAKEYRRFLEWNLQEKVIEKEEIIQVSLEDIENLRKMDAQLYKSYLLSSAKLNDSDSHSRSHVTVQRSIAALRSLFRYLSEQTENAQGQPYLSKNIMKSLEPLKDTRSMNERTSAIEKKLFLGDEALGYLEFIDSGYEEKVESRQALAAFKKNKVRDLAINALFLGTGMRLSELVNMNVSDLNLEEQTATVIRKGGKKDPAMIAPIFLDYLADYLEQRSFLYKPDEKEKALFLTTYKGKAKRMEADSVEKMVAKYSALFKTRITPHKLRHAVGTQMYAKTKNLITVSKQLGQSGTSATALYTHIVDKEQRDAVNDLWS